VFLNKEVFDVDKIKPGVVITITPKIMGVGDRYPRGLRRGKNYGIVTSANELRVVANIYNYQKDEVHCDDTRNIKVFVVNIKDVTGRNPALEIGVVE